MKVFIMTIFIFSVQSCAYLVISEDLNVMSKWSQFSHEEHSNLSRLIKRLEKSKTGRLLLAKARVKADQQNTTIKDVLKEGHSSVTDTTLIRRFAPENPTDITYETKSTVYINKDLDDYDAILDLAHELTHFIYRENFNPYEGNFTLPEFIKNTVESRGGEVHAYVMECRVLYELFSKKVHNRYHCHRIYDEKKKQLSYQLAVQEFYKIGPYYKDFHGKLGTMGLSTQFPHLSNRDSYFISSAYGMPYPVAAFKEYKTVMNKVCENDRKRIAYFSQTSGRSPASYNQAKNELETSYKKRCL